MKYGEFDILIVGAGVIGHSIAFRLKRTAPQLRIAVLGDPMNSLMASRAAAGMLAPFAECDVADGFFRFCRESLEMYPRFIAELVSVAGKPVHLSMNGSLMPSSSYEENWEERKRFFREENVPHEVWDPVRVRQKVPSLAQSCGEVMWVGEGQVNNRQMHDALVAATEKMGVTLLPLNVTGFIRNESSIGLAVTDAGEVGGKKIVLAAGSWSQQLAKILGVSLPLRPVKGQMCRVQAEDRHLPYTVHGLLTYIAPWREGNGFVLGSTMEDRGFDPAIEETVIQALIDNASVILPCLREAPLIESWTGLRPAARDGMPVMGKSGRYDNLYYSTGHFRNGILQTPHQAEYLTQTVLETLKEEIPEFSPSRYGL
ncbi:MAG: NAD(P)/FAD-dependent oxidoreductase [Nitrospinaceae bacterium]